MDSCNVLSIFVENFLFNELHFNNMTTVPVQMSDYVVYVDESGDSSLESINPEYPVFVLTFCVFEKKYYAHVATPALRMLKFTTFGHDMVVLHERDIRRRTGAFSSLNKEPREAFLDAVTHLIAQTDFTLLAVVIDKRTLQMQDASFPHTYHLATRLGLEKLYHFVKAQGHHEKLTHVVFEARGEKEDNALELEFQRVRNRQNSLQAQLPFELVIADKKANSEGLQFADMVARPLGLSVLRPGQSNRALKILEKKFQQIKTPQKEAHGIYLYP
jgi:hypothetical protein